jgi:RHS repeat-associated protein
VLRFTGELLDPTGLYDLRARQYDPGAGRFLGLDALPHNAMSPTESSYLYTGNQPTAYVDPSGLGQVVPNGSVWSYCTASGLFHLSLCAGISLTGSIATLGVGDFAWGAFAAGAEVDTVPIAGRITGYTRHGLNQAIGREGVGVSTRAILDAVRSPINVVTKITARGQETSFVGRNAVVVLNKSGQVITTFARNADVLRMPPMP